MTAKLGDVVFRHDEDAPSSDGERRLRLMAQQLVGLSMPQAFAVVQSLVVSLIGNNVPPANVELVFDTFIRQLDDRRRVTAELSFLVALKRAESSGHA